MGIPFSLTFKQGHLFINIQDFRETDSESSPSENFLVENVPLTVLFESSDPEARFYMDGLDTVPRKELKEDVETGDVYLSPSHTPVSLYENKTDFYPFIPGFYRIEVLVNGKWSYAWITIKPKQVDQESWEWMRDEIETTLSGLAKNFARQSTATGEIMDSFKLIRKWYSPILAAIEDIEWRPRERVTKSYRSIPMGRTAAIDMVTIRERCRHPEEMRKMKIPHSVPTYDTVENRLLKHYVLLMVEHFNTFIKSFENVGDDQHFDSIKRGLSKISSINFQDLRTLRFQDSYEKAVKLRKGFKRLLVSHWMNEISNVDYTQPTSALLSDSRYRIIYQFYNTFSYQELKRNQSLSFQWKRTDKLYEIWGFIKLINLIGKDGLNFQPIEGWLFDNNDQLAPELPKGTRIKFGKEHLTIQLVYDQKIPRRSSKTNSTTEPIFMTHGHNQPDTRMDFYYQGRYIGSLLIDFKYRPRVYLWQDDMIETTIKPKVMAQLIDYGNSCHSHFLFDSNVKSHFRDINPVLEVWAIYPDQERTGMSTFNEDYHVRLMEMTPNQSVEHIANELKRYIAKLVSRYQWFTDKDFSTP